MRTTLDIDEKLLEDIVRLMGEKNKNKAVNAALQEYLKDIRLKNLLKLQGNLDLDLDDWYEFRHMEQ